MHDTDRDWDGLFPSDATKNLNSSIALFRTANRGNNLARFRIKQILVMQF